MDKSENVSAQPYLPHRQNNTLQTRCHHKNTCGIFSTTLLQNMHCLLLL